MARPASVFATISSEQQRQELMRLWKEHRNHYTRLRAQAILLSARGYEVNRIVEILEVNSDSVRSWITRFEAGGVEALLDEDKPGGPRKLDEDEQELLKELIQQHPSEPAKVLAELKHRTGKELSRDALRDYARRFGLVWKRFRRSVQHRRDERAFRKAQAELAKLLQEPDLDVVYFDESGFSLRGVVSYGWQPIGQRLEVPVSGAGSPSIQALGLERDDGKTDVYLHKGYVKSQTVVDVLDDYSRQIRRPTVVVLDNAPSHTSAAFESAIARWEKKGLRIYHLPTYSPELNSIERLWKKVKYQLMPPSAWDQFTTLLATLTKKLREIGKVRYLPSLASCSQ